jgi:drug/metabolite transporter (DMT)-like permease
VLGLVEGRRTFDQMSIPRFAAWGAVGGAAFAAIFVLAAGLGGEALLGLGAVFGLASAACAAGSLALARRAADPASLDAGTDRARLGSGREGDP